MIKIPYNSVERQEGGGGKAESWFSCLVQSCDVMSLVSLGRYVQIKDRDSHKRLALAGMNRFDSEWASFLSLSSLTSPSRFSHYLSSTE